MASRADRTERFYKHEAEASAIPFVAWTFLGFYLIEDGTSYDAVLAGLGAVSALRALCWRMVTWDRYLGMESAWAEGSPPIGSLDFEPPILTMPEGLSLWLVPVGYLSGWAIGMETAAAHAFAGGIAAAIATGIVYRRIRNVELPFRESGS